METVETMRHFMNLAHMTREETVPLYYFIELATRQIEQRIKSPADVEAQAGILHYAAAALAYYRYTLSLSADAGSFKAGDVSVTEDFSTRVAFAQQAAQEALAAAAPLLLDDQFLFTAVGASGAQAE